MKSFFKWTGLILLAITVGLALAYGYSACAAAARPSLQVPPFSSVRPRGYGGWGMGPGMMNRWDYQGGVNPGNGTPISLDDAIEAAEGYLAAYGNPDLALTEVMEFSDNFYAEVVEQSTGIHAFELLIDRFTGYVHPEPGPNMMWNTKYGHMGGMTLAPGASAGVGGWRRSQAGSMSVSAEQAQKIAQQWLDRYLPGTSIAQEVDAFYGYYTIHVMKGDQIYGMLSVNGYTGEVWYHTWHGDFINMKELER